MMHVTVFKVYFALLLGYTTGYIFHTLVLKLTTHSFFLEQKYLLNTYFALLQCQDGTNVSQENIIPTHQFQA